MAIKKKATSKAASSTVRKAINKEIEDMHLATSDFVTLCIDLAKTHPKGLKRIESSIKRITANMAQLDKMYGRSGK